MDRNLTGTGTGTGTELSRDRDRVEPRPSRVEPRPSRAETEPRRDRAERRDRRRVRVARRKVPSHVPRLPAGLASVKDMQTWAGLTRLREAFERLRPRLVTFRDGDGVDLFDLPDAPRPDPDPDTPAPPRFLPEFDNLLLSQADRRRVVPPEHRGRSWRGSQAFATLLVDGFLAGVRKLEPDALVVEPFGRLGEERRREVTAEGERLLRVRYGESSRGIRFGTVIQ
ncbi:DNA glycosylase AlkZ-like family protein [Streptomyces sp. NPDC048737]|uniref:DNA glycosylase AlkZ-like family protein n=1 Tax=unclassified Streptomyces TaxID=2593676 RepID=UPI00341E05E0